MRWSQTSRRRRPRNIQRPLCFVCDAFERRKRELAAVRWAALRRKTDVAAATASWTSRQKDGPGGGAKQKKARRRTRSPVRGIPGERRRPPVATVSAAAREHKERQRAAQSQGPVDREQAKGLSCRQFVRLQAAQKGSHRPTRQVSESAAQDEAQEPAADEQGWAAEGDEEPGLWPDRQEQDSAWAEQEEEGEDEEDEGEEEAVRGEAQAQAQAQAVAEALAQAEAEALAEAEARAAAEAEQARARAQGAKRRSRSKKQPKSGGPGTRGALRSRVAGRMHEKQTAAREAQKKRPKREAQTQKEPPRKQPQKPSSKKVAPRKEPAGKPRESRKVVRDRVSQHAAQKIAAEPVTETEPEPQPQPEPEPQPREQALASGDSGNIFDQLGQQLAMVGSHDDDDVDLDEEDGTLSIECPEGVSAGDAITVTTGDGQELELEVPEGVGPGDTFEVAYE